MTLDIQEQILRLFQLTAIQLGKTQAPLSDAAQKKQQAHDNRQGCSSVAVMAAIDDLPSSNR
ncbi:hypothetical protein [Azoarcus sp. DD4]|uniref:hypothetical protein n=1 Tax=Azoarcus sp. DD4 TaxID=2027405 RepID=UPI00143CFD64|nr:hypothetical protein [Azoarcus sp. DD4]